MRFSFYVFGCPLPLVSSLRSNLRGGRLLFGAFASPAGGFDGVGAGAGFGAGLLAGAVPSGRLRSGRFPDGGFVFCCGAGVGVDAGAGAGFGFGAGFGLAFGASC